MEAFERALSPKVKLFFGYKDARCELKVIAPIGITVPATVPAPRIPKIKEIFDEAYQFNSKPEEDRKKAGGPWEREVEVRAKIAFGFPDGHVVISVRPAKIVPWLSVEITRDEHLQGKKAMDEVFMWYQLPADVREMQGAE